MQIQYYSGPRAVSQGCTRRINSAKYNLCNYPSLLSQWLAVSNGEIFRSNKEYFPHFKSGKENALSKCLLNEFPKVHCFKTIGHFHSELTKASQDKSRAQPDVALLIPSQQSFVLSKAIVVRNHEVGSFHNTEDILRRWLRVAFSLWSSVKAYF